MISIAPVKIASAPAYATYCGDAIGAIPARPAARIAAVAESAPTTRCREDPIKAKMAIGTRIVYRPVMTGIPAIVAYPMTSGMPSAAKVMPAIRSVDNRERSMGVNPSKTGRRRLCFTDAPRRVPGIVRVSVDPLLKAPNPEALAAWRLAEIGRPSR